MNKTQGANATHSAGAKGKGQLLILLSLSGALAVGAGIAVPFFLRLEKHDSESTSGAESKHLTGKRAYVQFGDVVVNLNEERLTRYLRVKLLLVVDSANEKLMNDLVLKNKPSLKNWLIGYLSDKSLQDVSGAGGVNKLRREIWREFNAQLFSDGAETIQDIFFEEFVVQ